MNPIINLGKYAIKGCKNPSVSESNRKRKGQQRHYSPIWEDWKFSRKETGNPNWKNGKSIYFCHKLANKLSKICSKCNSQKNIEIHHINFNPSDNRIDNFQILCKSCHTKIHNKFKNFNKKKMMP